MRTAILFLLVLLLVAATIEGRRNKGKGRRGVKRAAKKGPKAGPFVPCWNPRNLKSCTCKDNKEYKKETSCQNKRYRIGGKKRKRDSRTDAAGANGGGNIMKNCKKNENPIQFCMCVRGTKTWKWAPRRKLCGDRKNVKSCRCLRKDGKPGWTARRGTIWKKCGGYKRIQSCECKKGPKWENEEKYVPPKGKGKKD